MITSIPTVQTKVKYRNFFYAGMVSAGLLLCAGCSKVSKEMTPDLVEQIAIDAAGVSPSDVSGMNVEQNSPYKVTFSTPQGSYNLTIDEQGVVTAFQFNKGDQPNQSEESMKETSPDDNKPAENKTLNNPDQDQNKAGSQEANEKGKQDSVSKEELVRIAAAHLGLTSYDVDDFQMKEEQDGNKTLTVTLSDGQTIHVLINLQTRQVVSTIFQ